jgi:hypothetical protein
MIVLEILTTESHICPVFRVPNSTYLPKNSKNYRSSVARYEKLSGPERQIRKNVKNLLVFGFVRHVEDPATHF